MPDRAVTHGHTPVEADCPQIGLCPIFLEEPKGIVPELNFRN